MTDKILHFFSEKQAEKVKKYPPAKASYYLYTHYGLQYVK